MICLYAADESLFDHNGLGVLDKDLKKCQVEEELNNLYTLTALYPLGAKFGKSIRNGMIIKAPTPNGDQLFRIYQSKPSMGMLEIHAFHIFYDLAFNFVEDTNIVSKSGQAWLQQLSQNTQYRHPFTFFSDISTVAGSRVVRKNCVEILLNTSLDNSFVNRFGGEILRDNFKVYFNRAIGENRGFKIRHKKNLKGYTANIDDKSVITRLMPIGFDGLLLPEKYVDSPRISDYPFPRIGKVEVDVKAAVGENADAKDAVPLNEAYTKMRALIKEQFGVIDVPTCSYEVDFVELSKTKEYADFQNLETVRIGDTVTVSHDEDGFYVEAKVIRYEYDSLAGSLLRIEAGQFESRSSNNSINQQRSIEQQLEDVKIETSNMVQVAANGKNTIYRGIDRPANANVGDLWYEPLENSVVLKQWSGVDWELIPISDQNLGNVNVNNLSGNHIDVRRFRISSGDRDILYVNEAGEVILNAKRVQIDFTDVATKDDLKKIELTPGPKGEKGADGRTQYPHIAYAKAADIKPLNKNYDFSSGLVGWSKIGTINLNETSQTVTTQGKGIFYQPPSSNTTTASTSDYRIILKARNIQSENKTIRVGYLNVGKYNDITLGDVFSEYEFILKDVPTNQNFHISFNGTFEIDFVQICLNSAKYVDLSTEPSDDRPYMGIYIDDNETIVLDPERFKWSLIKGEQGPKGALDENQVREINDKIDGKADQVLTQEQLNALNERAGIMQAELEAKASLATVTQWFDAYQNFVKANDTARAQAEKDLIAASQRVSAIAKDLGELSDRWNFIDSYMSSSNEGLVIGKNDGSSSMMFSPNGRISMYSAGVEVMYISQGVIHIENGIFSKTIQIGRFREEQYHLNADMNIIRYVGG